MKPLYKGIALAVVHIAIVTSLGAKLLYDRATRPRVWVRAAPYDPDLPIRGRYVSLQLEVVPRDISPPKCAPQAYCPPVPVILSKEDDQLVARRNTQAQPSDAYREDRNAISFRTRHGSMIATLSQPVLFFIPEHVEDPSRRAEGEELWVEVTVPKKGPPRPIRLGVKKGDGPIQPLALD